MTRTFPSLLLLTLMLAHTSHGQSRSTPDHPPGPMTQAGVPGGVAFSATLNSIKIDARPGQVLTRPFQLKLAANQTRTQFKAHVEDFWRSPDGKQSFYAKPGTLRRSCARWASVNPVESAVGPGETLNIRITVTVPEELAAGGYWCALTVDEVPDPLQRASGVAMRFVASVSTGIFVNLEPVARAAQIVDLLVRNDEARVSVRNDGNTPVGIEGRLEFYAVGATTPRATVAVNRATVFTEPTTQSILTIKLPAAAELPNGRYRVRAILDFGGDHYIGAERQVEVRRAGAANASAIR